MGSESDSDMTIPTINSNYHRLASDIRKSYFEHLTKVIAKNYISWCGQKPSHNLTQIAYILELEAAAKSLVVPLYRENIVSLINSIEEYSCDKKLHPKLCMEHINGKVKNSSVQVNFKNPDPPSKRTKSTKDAATQILPEDFGPVPYDPEDDDLTKQLDELFHNDNEDIFGDLINKNLIAEDKDVTKPDTPNFVNEQTITPSDNIDDSTMTFNFPSESSNHIQNFSDSALSNIKTEPNEQYFDSNKSKYVYTKWPCELHFQKKKLCETLANICEKNWKTHSRVKKRFIELFDEDSDDELEPIFPNTSEEFLRSCRFRICPYVAHHMKAYFKHYNLSSKWFKPILNKLLHKIIDIKQYPSDFEVYLYVRSYFKNRSFTKIKQEKMDENF